MNTTTTTTATTDPVTEVFDGLLTFAGRILAGAAVLVWWAVLFPMISVPLGLAVAAGWWLGWPFGVGVAGVSVAGMVLWRVSSPQTFERVITGRARTRFLTWFRYRRRWTTILTACDLATRDNDRVYVPRLVSVDIGETLDMIHARMLPGHCPESWFNRRDHLAHGFGAQQAQVKIAGPGLVQIMFRRCDSLADPVVVPFESVAGFRTLPDTKAA
ncbi:hypothetical protein BOX37_05230 [Nocardia mangyaensis]|uniref:Uncharacterized protein n=1 Tax=Nocardia mangyaensis TaxID=2213200 RepID=A0A1J0VN99_9NOCA|nr:hypothetical protein [Nocardia mangyaensis]APE33471.1 hypothetical protein BOX37_05230 [Nocardia mangyaensis]